MGANRTQKKENQQNKRTNFDNKHNSKHVRTKQAILTKRQQDHVEPNFKTKSGKSKKH